MIIEIKDPKFEVGQTIWYFIDEYVPSDCTACINGQITLKDNEEYTCPKCEGSGRSDGERKKLLKTGILSEIIINSFSLKSKNKISLHYKVKDFYYSILEDSIFLSKTEAENFTNLKRIVK